MESTPNKEEKEALMLDAIKTIVASNQPEAVIAGFEILHKLISNILKNPTEDKFRQLKKTNKAIQAKLMGLQPSEKLM